MKGEALPKIESLASELLLEFQRLFGLINSQDNDDLSIVAERIKKLIFKQLIATGRLDNETNYEAWLGEIFPNNESLRPTLLIEMAEEYEILNHENTSEIFCQKLIQLLNDYRNRNRFNLNQALIAEIEEVIDSNELTANQYDTLASKLLSQVYR